MCRTATKKGLPKRAHCIYILECCLHAVQQSKVVGAP